MVEFARLNRKKDMVVDVIKDVEGENNFEDMGDESPLFRCVVKESACFH